MDSHAADQSATAALAAFGRARVAGARRHRLYLYGQSLGAVGADSARRWAGRHGVDVCGTVLAGPPAGDIEAVATRRMVLSHSSDPVTTWSPRLLTAPPSRSSGPPDLPRPQWFLLVSWLQTGVDLLTSLSVPTGHGHRYGVEQGYFPTDCGPQTTAGSPPTGPRAAS